MYSTIADLCSPALFFLVIFFFDIVFIVFGKSKNQNKPLDRKIKGFLVLCLCAIGWSFIINSMCDYEQNVAWGLALIPLFLFVLK